MSPTTTPAPSIPHPDPPPPPPSSSPSPPPRPLVISGPSGTGKSTILTRLFTRHPHSFGFSVSHTTRAPRPGEVDGQHYHFVSRQVFEQLRDRDRAAPAFFIETAEFGGNLYGTSRSAVEDVALGRGVVKGESGLESGRGRCCVLDIEMEGVKQLHDQATTTTMTPRFLFLSPPSLPELERRLRSRATDSESAIARRLDQARREMDFAQLPGSHDKVVVNDDLERAYEEVEAWVFGAEGGLGGVN